MTAMTRSLEEVGARYRAAATELADAREERRVAAIGAYVERRVSTSMICHKLGISRQTLKTWVNEAGYELTG